MLLICIVLKMKFDMKGFDIKTSIVTHKDSSYLALGNCQACIYSNNDRDIMFPFPLRDLLTVQGHTCIAARSNTALHSS